MELALNFLWLLVALGILYAWRVCWVRHGRVTRHDPVVEWAAVGSALVLLFFAISLSDDLHQDVVLFSESSTSRRQLVVRISGADTSGNRGASAVHDGQLGSAVPPRTAPRHSLGFWGQVASPANSSVSKAQFRHFSGRSPPAFFL